MFAKFIPILASGIILVGWEVLFYVPQQFFTVFGVLLAVLLMLLLKFNRYRILDAHFWLLIFPALSLIVFTATFLLFLNNAYLQQTVIILIVIAVYYYLKYLFNFLYRISSYTPLSLETASSYFSVVSFLFLSVSVFGLINFLNAQLWYLAVLVMLMSMFTTYQFLWINKIEKRLCVFTTILVSVLIVEFFWAISFFPISHFVSGLALAIIYYIIVNLSLFHLLETLDKRVAQIYLSIGLVCLFIILLSARWL